MDHQSLGSMQNEQALDFTSVPKRSRRVELVESPVLDLSCKKQNSSSCSLSPVSMEPISNPPSIEMVTEENSREGHYGEPERKSPFGVRNSMVTPPSEADSPGKPQYEGTYMSAVGMAPIATNGVPNSHYAMLSTSLALPSTGLQMAIPLQFPVPTSTMPSLFSHPITGSISCQESSKKAPRPFKAYPKNPLSISLANSELLCDPTSTEAFAEFRRRMLESVRQTNEGTNIKMRRATRSSNTPTSTTMDEKTATYWERRRKNNEAAKRSRDARRAKEDEIAIRAAFLEQENIKLRYELIALRTEANELKCIMYTN